MVKWSSGGRNIVFGMSKLGLQACLAVGEDADFIFRFQVACHSLTHLVHVGHPKQSQYVIQITINESFIVSSM